MNPSDSWDEGSQDWPPQDSGHLATNTGESIGEGVDPVDPWGTISEKDHQTGGVPFSTNGSVREEGAVPKRVTVGSKGVPLHKNPFLPLIVEPNSPVTNIIKAPRGFRLQASKVSERRTASPDPPPQVKTPMSLPKIMPLHPRSLAEADALTEPPVRGSTWPG